MMVWISANPAAALLLTLALVIAAACVASVAVDSAIPDYQDKLLAWAGKRLHFIRPPAAEGAQQSS